MLGDDEESQKQQEIEIYDISRHGLGDAHSVGPRMSNNQLLGGGKSCVPTIPLNRADAVSPLFIPPQGQYTPLNTQTT